MPLFREHHLRLPFITFDYSRNLRLLFVIRVARDVINKLAIFFLPLYLFQMDTGNWQLLSSLSPLQRGILFVASYYLLNRVVVVFTAIPLSRLVNVFGHQLAMTLAHLSYIVFIACLYASISNPLWVLVALIFDGVQSNLFWNSQHTLLSRVAMKSHMGEDLGILQFLLQLAAALVPALGGLLIVNFGYASLFTITILGVMVGLVFSLLLTNKKEPDIVSYGELWSWMSERRFLRLAVSVVGRYMHDAALVLWIIYVFVLLGRVDSVGFLFTLSLFFALMVSLLIGVYVDHRHSKRPFIASGGVLTLLWMARTQVFSFWQVAIVDTIEKLTGNAHWLFYDTWFMRRGKGSQDFSYFVYRQMIMSLGAVGFWLLVIALFVLTRWEWMGIFVLGAVGVIFSLFITEKT